MREDANVSLLPRERVGFREALGKGPNPVDDREASERPLMKLMVF